MASNSPPHASDENHDFAHKRRRPSLRQPHPPGMLQEPFLHDHVHEGSRSRHDLGDAELNRTAESKDASISIATDTKQAGMSVTPFLTNHIPQQYGSSGAQFQQTLKRSEDKSEKKYCNRHRPDRKCRGQANEPSMEQLQNELGSLPQSDQQGIAHVWSLFSAAPPKQRNLMLRGILAQCCCSQLSLISSMIHDLTMVDFLDRLPPELGFKILCYLDTASLCKAAQVSRKWRMLADDDVVWHKMCEQHIDRKCVKCGWGLPLLEKKRLRIEKRQIQLRATGRGLNEWSPNITPHPEEILPIPQDTSGPLSSPRPSGLAIVGGTKRSVENGLPSPEASVKRACTQSLRADSITDGYFQPRAKRPWKDVYKDRFKVGTNWKYGRCSIKTFKGHTNGVMCLQFDDRILATGSYDCTIKIWDIETGKELQTLAGPTGHTSGIRCLQFDEKYLFSGSIDKTIKMWNWRTGECMRTLQGHSAGVITLHFGPRFIASGSMDNTITVWSLKDSTRFKLCGHTDWVNSVKIDFPSRTLFSSSDDCTVKLWDLDTKRVLRTFEGHVGQVQQVLPLPPEFELDEDVMQYESDSDTDFDESTGSPASSQVSEQQEGQQQPVNPTPITITPLFPDGPEYDPARPSPPRYMLTAALDSTLRLWDVRTGKTIRVFFGHLEGIWALAADTLRMVSGAEDRMVKIWDPRTGKCERTFMGHSAAVTCVGLSDSRLVSGGEEGEVRVQTFAGEGCTGQSNGVVGAGD